MKNQNRHPVMPRSALWLTATVLALLLTLCLSACDLTNPASGTEPTDTAAPTEAPATAAPTEAPATAAPTEAPATAASTEAPATDAPATDTPTTDVPATDAPATEGGETEEPPAETYRLDVFAADPTMGSVTAAYENGDPITLPLSVGDEPVPLVLTATPAEGFVFDGWYLVEADGSESRFANEAQFTLSPQWRSLTLVARFLPTNEFELTLRLDGEANVWMNGDAVTPDPTVTVTVKAEDVLHLVAQPAPGYEFVGWFTPLEDGTLRRLTREFDAQFIMPASDATVIAILDKQDTLIASVEDPAHGIITVAGEEGTYTRLEKSELELDLTVTAHPAHGFRFVGWYDITEEPTLLTAEATVRLTPDGDLRVEARFIPLYALRVSASEGGIICLNHGEVTKEILTGAANGEELHLEAYPDAGYAFIGFWRVHSNGIPISLVSMEKTCVIPMIPETYYVMAFFEKLPEEAAFLSVQANDASLGGFTVDGDSERYTDYEGNGKPGTVRTFRAEPAEGCLFVGWYLMGEVGDTLLSADKTFRYTFTENSASIVARFIRGSLITIEAQGPGTIVYNGTAIEDTGRTELLAPGIDAIRLKAIPVGDSVFLGWFYRTENGYTPFGNDLEVIFTVPTADSTLVAIFEQKRSISITTSGLDTPALLVGDSEEPVKTYGSYELSDFELELTATVPEGYHFYGWYTPVDGSLALYSRETDVKLTVADEDIRLVARYGELRTVTVKIVGGGAVYHENTGITYTEDFTLTMAPGEYFVLSAPPTEELAMTGWFTADAQGNPSSLVTTVCMMFPFRTPNEDWVLVALFEPRCTFSAVVSTLEGGGIRVNDEEQLRSNWGISTPGSYSVTVTAVPAEGYVFLGWYRDPYGQRELYSTDARINVSVAEDMTLEALFVIEEAVRVNVISNEYYEGLVFLDGDEVPEGSDGVEVMIGSRVQLYAHPIWDSRFVAWFVYNSETDDYELYSTAAHLWVTVTEEARFLAVFEPIPYISINGSAHIPGYEEGDPLPTLTLNGEELDDFFLSYEDQEGTVITIVTGDLEGYEFLGWYTEIWDSENWSDEPGEPGELLTTSHTYVLTLEGADEFRILAVYAPLNP